MLGVRYDMRHHLLPEDIGYKNTAALFVSIWATLFFFSSSTTPLCMQDFLCAFQHGLFAFSEIYLLGNSHNKAMQTSYILMLFRLVSYLSKD